MLKFKRKFRRLKVKRRNKIPVHKKQQLIQQIYQLHLTLTNIGCPNKNARFNFVINAPFIQKVLIFLFQYKVCVLQIIVEHNIRQMSPTTQESRGGRQCAHFKPCALFGTRHTNILFAPSS